MSDKVGEVTHAQFPPYPGLHYLDLAFAASYANRFHMVKVRREQNLTDHSIRVGYVWRVLFKKWRDSVAEAGRSPEQVNPELRVKRFHELDLQRLELLGLKLCMDHDLAEVLCGDVPSHTKSPEIKVALDATEDHIFGMVVDGRDHLQHLLDPEVRATDEWRVAKALLKLADIAEGLVYSYNNQGDGPLSPDAKWRWVNDNWSAMARRYILSLDPRWFTTRFKNEVGIWIVEKRLDVAPQHA
jgi:hypothetical protein